MTSMDGAEPATNRSGATKHPAFVTTHWSVVLAAGRTDSTRARAALERLCRTYWYPLYAYVRRSGHSPEDAADLTQEFFARLLEHHWLARADQSRGRFRSFLLMTLKRFLVNEWKRARTQKRGGAMGVVALSVELAESRFAAEPVNTTPPELSFEKQWALTLLEEVLGRLGAEYAEQGKGAVFDALKPCLIGSREMQPYNRLAAELGLTEGAVKTAVSRLRQRYRERLEEEIANTVATPEDVKEELRHLFRVLARSA